MDVLCWRKPDMTVAMKVTSIGPQTVRKARGETVVLGCTFIADDADRGELDIEWSNMSPDTTQKDAPVLGFSGGEVFHYGSQDLGKRLSFTAKNPALGDASISITDLKLGDTATYQCKVKKTPGIDTRKVTLVVEVRPSVPRCSVQGSQDEGSSVSLSCKSDEGMIPLTYKWERESGGGLPPTAIQTGIHPLLVDGDPAGIHLLLVGMGTAGIHPLLVDGDPAGIHLLLVGMGTAGIHPLLVDGDPAGIHLLLVGMGTAGIHPLLVGEVIPAGIHPLLVGEVLPAGIHPLLVGEVLPAGIHPLLVGEVLPAGIHPLLVGEVLPAGIHPLLVGEVLPAGIHPLLVGEVLPAGIHPLLVGEVLPAGIHPLLVGEVLPAGIHPLLVGEVLPAGIHPLLVGEVLPAGIHPLLVGEVLPAGIHPLLVGEVLPAGIHPLLVGEVLPAGIHPLLVGEVLPAGIHPLLVGEVLPAGIHPLLVGEVLPAGIHPLLVGEVLPAGIHPLLVGEVLPAGIHPLLVGEVLPAGIHPLLVGEVLPAGIHPLLVDGDPAGIHLLLVGEVIPAGIHPLLVHMGTAGIFPLLVEVEPAGILPLLAAWVLGLWKPRLPLLWAVDAQAPPAWVLASWHRGILTSHVPLPHTARTSSVEPRSSPSSGDPPLRIRCTRGTGSLAPLAAVAVVVGAVGAAVYLPLLVVETEATPAPPSPDGQGSGPHSAHLRRWGIVEVAVRGGTRGSWWWNAQAQRSSNTRAAVPSAGVVVAVAAAAFLSPSLLTPPPYLPLLGRFLLFLTLEGADRHRVSVDPTGKAPVLVLEAPEEVLQVRILMLNNIRISICVLSVREDVASPVSRSVTPNASVHSSFRSILGYRSHHIGYHYQRANHSVIYKEQLMDSHKPSNYNLTIPGGAPVMTFAQNREGYSV
ncbi:UNVERIFIED_CONTAM: hypothetical protein FKN15_052195 [Acipenser sinensis]